MEEKMKEQTKQHEKIKVDEKHELIIPQDEEFETFRKIVIDYLEKGYRWNRIEDEDTTLHYYVISALEDAKEEVFSECGGSYFALVVNNGSKTMMWVTDEQVKVLIK